MSRARDFADLGSSVDTGGLTGRNLFINGAMQVAQRGTSSTASGMNTIDRFEVTLNGTDQLAVTQSQSTTVPSGQGFSNSLKVEVTTPETTMNALEFFRIIQKIEAQNLQHLAFGSSSAKPLTLSFWVRSSLAGKYSILFFRGDASPSRSNTPSYTINVADTWEYKTITIDGDTTGGVIANDNGAGINITWTLAAGAGYAGTPHTGWGDYAAGQDFSHSDQVNFAAQTGTFYLTGVQVEVGGQATSFEHEDIGTTLRKCHRYYYQVGGTNSYEAVYTAAWYSADTLSGDFYYPVDMRAAPSVSFTGAFQFLGGGGTVGSSISGGGQTNTRNIQLTIGSGSGGTVGKAGVIRANNDTDARVKFDAEL